MTRFVLALIGFAVFSCQQKKMESPQLDNVFYVFNNGVRTLPNAPSTYEGQAALVKSLGYDGLAGHREEFYYDLRAAMDIVGLEMPEMYIAMNIEDGRITYHDELRNILTHSKNRDLLVALHLHANEYTNNTEEGDRIFASGIQELADFAAPLNIQIAIYPHVNFYCETLEHAFSIATAADRENVGVVFNLSHLLKVEGESGWQEKAVKILPKLFMVSINGADTGETQDMGWDRLIQPLGEGTFDTYALVKFMKDQGYEGKFGLQCYNIKQDCEKALQKSINTWREFQRRYAQASAE
jgi:sugar phosphate isomerase/epimerase